MRGIKTPEHTYAIHPDDRSVREVEEPDWEDEKTIPHMRTPWTDIILETGQFQSQDEFEVWAEIALTQARRINRGRELYGTLDLVEDKDWGQEALEESLDGTFYLACRKIRRRRRG